MSIQTPAFISYCSPVQGRMAGASTSVYEFDNVVRGQHICKWSCIARLLFPIFICGPAPTNKKW